MNSPTVLTPRNPCPKQTWRRRALWFAVGLLAAYGLVAYVLVPAFWRHDLTRHPWRAGGPRLTHTANDIPGDPVNLALLGDETQVIRAMLAAHWRPADPITLHTSLRIAVDSVFRRPDDEAPVSNLYLFGHKQDLAFELPVGDSPRQRHHVRYWRWDGEDDGRPVWFGAASFDERVGLSHTTGQITHHIGPNVDAERDRILRELQQAGWAASTYYLNDFHTNRSGRNGGGDPWHTDGRLGVVVLRMGTNAPAGE